MLECKGFEPKEKLTQIVGMNGELQSYLEVKYRIEWFNQYCAENDIKGVIDESDIKYLEQVKMFVATRKIYMDDKLVATGIGGKMVDGDITSMNMIIQSAATIAKGRALANCGFGTAMCANNESGENTKENHWEKSLQLISNILILWLTNAVTLILLQAAKLF